MVTIEVHPSVCKVTPFDQNLYNLCTPILKYPVKEWGTFKPSYKYLITESGYFPTGLVGYVSQIFSSQGIEHKITLAKKTVKPYAVFKDISSDPTPYPEQIEAVKSATFVQRGVISMPTGVGKSMVIKLLILAQQTPTLVICPLVDLTNQLRNYLNASLQYSGENLFVTNIDAIKNQSDDFFKQFGMVIYDEIHHGASNEYREIDLLKLNHIWHKFGTTATNYRNLKAENILLHSLTGCAVYSLSTQEAIQKGYIRPVQTMISPLTDNEDSSAMPYREMYSKFIVENEERNSKIINISNKLIEKRRQTLILVKEVEHGRQLLDQIPNGIFVHGACKEDYRKEVLKSFNACKIPCVIGTSVFGEGIDTKSCECVVMAAGEKSEIKVRQNVGRGVRNFQDKKYCYVFDFDDPYTKVLHKHYNKRKSIYKNEYGSKPILLG